MKAERDILADILIAVTAMPDAFLIRTNTGQARTASGKQVRFGRPGQPDIVGCVRGRYVVIEAKTQRGTQSAHQRNWQANVERAKGLYILARSVEDVMAALATIP